VRIEKAYGRLLPGRDTFIRIRTTGLLQADFRTRMEGYQFALQSRVRKVDEVRALEDLAPFGEANGGGFLDTPNNRTPDPRIADLAALVRAGFEPAAACAYLGLPDISHTGVLPVPTAGRTPA